MPARVSGNRVSIRFAGPQQSNNPDDAPSLIKARLLAGVRGWDQEAAFDPKTARVAPAWALGRILGDHFGTRAQHIKTGQFGHSEQFCSVNDGGKFNKFIQHTMRRPT
jgi:hypothetical protein